MGKGTCKKTKVTEEKRISPKQSVHSVEPVIEQIISIQESVHDDKDDQNKNLIEYQQQIEKNPRNITLTKTVFTKDMALDMSNIRTESGLGLGNCVYVNVKNPRSKCPYAVSADCYNTFADFFGEIIEEIHGDPQNEAILFPQFGDLKGNSTVDLNSYNRKRGRAMYTEVCIRRNLQDIPFTSTIKSKGRKEVISQLEEKVRNLLNTSEEIAEIPFAWDKRMDEIKNDIDECGAMRDYPDDRMTIIFKNDKNIYQGCVLNFDDHVQYVVSTNDGRIGEIFGLSYCFLADETMSDINYSAHPIFGHLTLSPAHVGTGMNIRVAAKFPFASRLADINSVIEDLDCVTENDKSNVASGILMLTNTKTLNTTEEIIFKNIIMAFNKLSELEDELEITTAMAVQDDAMCSEDLNNLFNIIKNNKFKTYTKKYFTEAVLMQCGTENSNFGSSFNNCVRHNAYFPRSLYPRACDSNSYLKFSRFFDPILLETNRAKSFSHPKLPSYGSTLNDRRYKLHHPIILSYRVRFNRNFELFPFPMMMSSKDRSDVERIMIKAFEDLPVELEGDYCPIKSIKDSIYYEEILNYRLAPNSCEVDVSAGFYRDWPKNRGIFISKRNINYPNIILIVIVNVLDHIKVISLDPTGKALNACYERAVSMMKLLDLKFSTKYAKKSGYGFLTSVPCFVGCAMRISAMIILKNLGEKREKLEKECIASQIVCRGSNGHGTIGENNVFDLSLNQNMNVTEKYLLMMFVQRLQDVISIERQYDPRIHAPSKVDEEDESYNEDFEEPSETKQNSEKSETKVNSEKSAEIDDANEINTQLENLDLAKTISKEDVVPAKRTSYQNLKKKSSEEQVKIDIQNNQSKSDKPTNSFKKETAEIYKAMSPDKNRISPELGNELQIRYKSDRRSSPRDVNY